LGRGVVPLGHPDEMRGHVLLEHQHYLPDDWQAQLRVGYTSDPTFLEEWFRREFEEGSPHDVSFYLKRQRETEAFTFGLQFQPNDVVTTADQMQEQFEVEHVPQIGYHRIGDSFADDKLTFFTDDTFSGVRF